jgi:hypothetical protein
MRGKIQKRLPVPNITSNMQRFIPATLLENLNSNTVRITLEACRDYCQPPKENLPFEICTLYKISVFFLLCPYCCNVLASEKFLSTNYSTLQHPANTGKQRLPVTKALLLANSLSLGNFTTRKRDKQPQQEYVTLT